MEHTVGGINSGWHTQWVAHTVGGTHSGWHTEWVIYIFQVKSQMKSQIFRGNECVNWTLHIKSKQPHLKHYKMQTLLHTDSYRITKCIYTFGHRLRKMTYSHLLTSQVDLQN